MRKRIAVIFMVMLAMVFLTSITVHAGRDSLRGAFFTTYNPNNDAAYIFDSAGLTTDAAGWVPAGGFQQKTVFVQIITQGSTTIHLIIQGRAVGLISSLYTKNYAAVTTFAEEIPLTGNYDEVRMGFKVTTNGTDSVSAVYLFERWE